MKSLWVLLFLLMAVSAYAQEREVTPVEIEAQERTLEDQIEQGLVKEVREVDDLGIPEVPKRLKDRELTAAEKERLAQIEQEENEGDLTKPEKDLESEVLFRESNVKF